MMYIIPSAMTVHRRRKGEGGQVFINCYINCSLLYMQFQTVPPLPIKRSFLCHCCGLVVAIIQCIIQCEWYMHTKITYQYIAYKNCLKYHYLCY